MEKVHVVGKIDRDIYKCISEELVTDEVIITDNQLQHIKERHSDAYEKALLYLGDAIEQPDYIIADKHINTGLVVKAIKRDNTHIQVVVRLCTAEDAAGYKNSVISCWEISNQRLQNYLRNKEIIYKRL